MSFSVGTGWTLVPQPLAWVVGGPEGSLQALGSTGPAVPAGGREQPAQGVPRCATVSPSPRGEQQCLQQHHGTLWGIVCSAWLENKIKKGEAMGHKLTSPSETSG